MSISYTTARATGGRGTSRIEGHAGRVALPGDAGWDAARQAWNLFVDQHPAAVLFPESPADVAAAVRVAQAAGLSIAVQGTGHGAAALGDLGDAVLIRTSSMRGVQIDPSARRARVEAGAVWDEVVRPAVGHGLTALHGSSPDVGVVGYTLGGGIGWLARLYGLAASSVTAIELVTADGEQVRTDDDHDPDLFWGLRGGGTNFGVVTALELELFPLEHAYAGWLVWDWEHAQDVLDRWVEWTSTTPTGITSTARILRLPPLDAIPAPLRGRDLVVIEAAYVGSEESGARLLRPLRELQPELDTFATVPAGELARLHRDPEGPTPGIGSGGLVDELPPVAIDAFLAVAGPGSGSPLVSAELRQLGGALARPAPGGGALSHLDGAFAFFSVGVPGDDGATRAVEQRVADVGTALAPWGSGRVFSNFADKAEDARSMFTAETYNRLRALKTRMDPGGSFRASQVIPAASDVS
jgi:FAD/FMN-containing dehydrogenase